MCRPPVLVGSASVNTRYLPDAISMLAHRLRRWPIIETSLGKKPYLLGALLSYALYPLSQLA